MEIPLVKLWMNPINLQSYEFLSNFGSYIRHFGSLINFVPVYRFSDRIREAAAQHAVKGRATVIGKYCYTQGSFCSNGIINNIKLTRPLKVLDQGIKQTCLFNYDVNKYLDFVPKYKEECLENLRSKNFDVDLCGTSIMIEILGQDEYDGKVQKCYDGSWNNPKYGKYLSSNKILSQSAGHYSPASSPVIPSFLIKDFAFKVKFFFPLSKKKSKNFYRKKILIFP